MSDLQRILWQRLQTDANRALGPDWTEKKIILYGAGGLGASFLRTFPHLSIAYFVDSAEERDQTEFEGLPVYSPGYLAKENSEEIVVFITSSWHEEIRFTLESLGLVFNQHFCYGIQKAHGRIFFYLPEISDFARAFSWFNERGASYAILRWFDSLPHVTPEDIHILFETQDLSLLFENPYLSSEPLGIQLEVYWSRPLGQEDELLSYPTWLGCEILTEREEGPGGAFVPPSSVYLKSLAYHVVFHKAESAQIPVDGPIETCWAANKYARQLSKLAAELSEPVHISLEGLWDYLDSANWLPPTDLARRYASDLKSPWLTSKLGSVNESAEDILIFVFREWLTERPGLYEAVLAEIGRLGLEQIITIALENDEKAYAYEQIRGGNWIETAGSRKGGGPAAFGVFRDPNPMLPSAQERLMRPFCTNQKLTLKTNLKQRICDAFNEGDLVNFLHAADDLREGSEYLNCLARDRRDAVYEAIDSGKRISIQPNAESENYKESEKSEAADGLFVVFGAGTNQLPVIEAGKRRGWTVFAIDRNPEAPGATLADRFLCASLRDYDQITSELSNERIRGIAARVLDRDALTCAQRLAAERRLPSACPGLLDASTSKVALADACGEAGLRTPRRYFSGEPIDWENGSVILRPDVSLRGKVGIYRVGSQTDFDRRYPEAKAASGSGHVDISEWIEGVDILVLAELKGGVATRFTIFDEWVALDAQARVAGMGVGCPSIFEGDPRQIREIDLTLDALASVFPKSRSLVTLSLRIDRSGQAWIIEIHLGIGGDGIADQLIPAAVPGFDAFDAFVAACAGEFTSTPQGAPLPRGLVRSEEGWRLIQARDKRSLDARVRATVPEDWELPLALEAPRDAIESHASSASPQGIARSLFIATRLMRCAKNGARRTGHDGQRTESRGTKGPAKPDPIVRGTVAET